jgi:outer membrane protein TolC
MMQRRLYVIIGILTAISVLGCRFNEDKEVARYRQVLDTCATSMSANCPATMPGHTLTLQQAMAIANQNSERLAISGENYVQTLIAKDLAYCAFLPTVGVGAVWTGMGNPMLPSGAGPFSQFVPTHAWDVPLNLQLENLNPFRDVAAIQAAAADTQKQHATLLDMQAQVLVEVAQVYYQVLRTTRVAQVLENSVTVQDNRVQDLQNKLRAGTVRALDVSQAKAQAASTRVELLGTRNDTAKALSTLAFLIGVPKVQSALVDDFNVPATPSLDELRHTAAANRQDILAARAAVDAATRAAESAFEQYFPSVSVNLTKFLHRESFPQESLWAAVFEVNAPIFSGFQIEASCRTALSQLRQARQTLSLTQRQVLENVEIVYANFTYSRAVLEQIQIELQAANDAYNQAVQAYNAGVSTNLETLIAQDQLMAAQVRQASQEFEYKVSYLTLLRTVGLLCPTGASLQKPMPTTMPTTAPVPACL